MDKSKHQIPVGIHKVVNIYGIGVYSILMQCRDKAILIKKEVYEQSCSKNCTRGEFNKGWKELHEKGFLIKKSGLFNGVRHPYWEFEPLPSHVDFNSNILE